MANNCQIPTPVEYANIMLDYINYKNDLYGKRVLENSCGEGNILIEIVKRYIIDLKSNGYSKKQIEEGLARDIIAFEIDSKCIETCIFRLNNVTFSYHLEDIQWHIENKDYLDNPIDNADYIIGNPPYITYHNLADNQREYVQKHFKTCRHGRFDYCYAFIEASLAALGMNGKMVYLIPFSIFKNKFASDLREYILPYLLEIYDYRTIQIFPKRITSSAIIVCENGKEENSIFYKYVIQNTSKKIKKNQLNGKWVFNDPNVGEKKFGDFFKVSNSVATLCNEAFLLDDYTKEDQVTFVKGLPIENEVIKEAASTKSIKMLKNHQKRSKIIFPYKIYGKEIKRYSNDEFKECFPNATKYLEQFKEKLDARQADEKSSWFEYGRSQSLESVMGKKLVMPMVITKAVTIYEIGEGSIPYAGYYIKKIAGGELSLKEAKQILESKHFYEYVKEHGTPTTAASYRISVNDIKNYMF